MVIYPHNLCRIRLAYEPRLHIPLLFQLGAGWSVKFSLFASELLRPRSEAATPRLRFSDILCCDPYRYYGRIDFLTFLRAYFRVKAFRFTFWLRAAAYFRLRHGVPATITYVVCRLLLDHYSLIYGYQIHDKTQIGPGLYLGHFGSVVINPAATIGRNVNVAVAVTIGQTNRGPRAGVPTLGDRVWVGTNAIVVGASRLVMVRLSVRAHM
jgi:serine O-acetyltransferase